MQGERRKSLKRAISSFSWGTKLLSNLIKYMTDINKGGEVEAPKTPQADQFGVTMNPDGTEYVPPVEAPAEEPKKDKDGKPVVEKKSDAEDIENHPAVVALRTKIEEFSTNLTGQRTAHEKEVAELNKKLADALTGKKPEEGAEVMFKDIKFSKDLTKEERDDMTDAEIALFDQNANMQVAMNKMFETVSTVGKKTEETVKTVEEQKVEDLNASAKVEAVRLADEAIKTNPTLAKDARELADKIIVEFNEFNNVGLTPEKLLERMKKALNNVSGYVPPKEAVQHKPTGDPVSGGGKPTDQFGVDAIVAGVNKKNDGNYDL